MQSIFWIATALIVMQIRGNLPMFQGDRQFPPLIQGVEEAKKANEAFVNACKKKLAKENEIFNDKFETEIVTHSPLWGMIWRADFHSGEFISKTGLINRVVCWAPDSDADIRVVTYFGQSTSPLGLNGPWSAESSDS